MNVVNNIKKIFLIFTLVLAIILIVSGCVCPLLSLFERSTGLSVWAGDNIDESVVIDELIYPGSAALVQVTGDIEKIIDLVSTYGVSFSDDQRQALEDLPESITRQDVGIIVYSTPDARTLVLSYYERLTGRGWQIDAFRGPGTGIQDSDIVIAVKDERRQALMVSGSQGRSFIIFIDFDWNMFEDQE
jgi:hypothetical protein